MTKSFTIFFTALISMEATDSVVAQNFWQRVGLDSLYVYDFAFNSQGHVFAGTDRGVFRSTNNGDNWTQINSGLTDTSVTALSVNSVDHVFAGTWNEGGVYRSTDVGTTWMQVFGEGCWSSIATNSSDHIFVGAVGYDCPSHSGIWRSTDNGKSWDSLGLNILIEAIEINKSGDIFTGGGFGVSNIYRSSDNGANWTLLYAMGGGSGGGEAIVFQQNGIMYWAPGVNDAGVLRSTDNGTTWDTVNAGLSNLNVWSLAIDSNEYIYAGTPGGGVFHSSNNGISWDTINTGLTNRSVWSLAVSPSGYVFAATWGGGVFRSVQSTTSVREVSRRIPAAFALEQNYPNPFNPSTVIRYSLPVTGYVTLKVYNALGQEVASLVNEELKPGTYEVRWDASGFASGVYFYRLQAGSLAEMKKLMLIR